MIGWIAVAAGAVLLVLGLIALGKRNRRRDGTSASGDGGSSSGSDDGSSCDSGDGGGGD